MKSIARTYGWASPSVLNDFYCDELDNLGIYYWYKDVLDQQPKKK